MATTSHHKSKSKKKSSPCRPKRTPWRTASLQTLIDRVKPHRELWDCIHPSFRRKDIKRVLWRHIAAELRSEFVELAQAELSADEALSKFNIMKASFLRETRRVFEQGIKKPKWKFFQTCKFMTNQYTYLRKTRFCMLSDDLIDDEDLCNKIYSDVASDPLALCSSVLPANPVSSSSANDLITGMDIQPHSPTQSTFSDASAPSKTLREYEVQNVEQIEEENTEDEDEDKLVTYTGDYLKSYMNLLQGDERKVMAQRLIQVIRDHRLELDNLA